MNKDDEKRVAARLARIMAMLCVRKTQLETMHAGLIENSVACHRLIVAHDRQRTEEQASYRRARIAELEANR